MYPSAYREWILRPQVSTSELTLMVNQHFDCYTQIPILVSAVPQIHSVYIMLYTMSLLFRLKR